VGRFSGSPDTHPSSTVRITLRGLDALPGFAAIPRITVVVQQIPDHGSRSLSSPKLLMQQSVATSGGTGQLSIPRLDLHNLYALTVVAPT
jgi:hypothetical protein